MGTIPVPRQAPTPVWQRSRDRTESSAYRSLVPPDTRRASGHAVVRRRFSVADLFCGAGGTSTGCLRAVREMGAELDLVAINHWDTAIATHTRNHPFARRFCSNLDATNPAAIVEGGRLDLLLASPELHPFLAGPRRKAGQ